MYDWMTLTMMQRIERVRTATLSKNSADNDETSDQPPTGLYIFPDAFGCAPMSSLDAMSSHISACDVTFEADGTIHHSSFEDILGLPTARFLVNVYDRAPLVADWYYSLYGITEPITNSEYAIAANPIVDAVMPKGSEPVKGPVIVVLNGPSEGIWKVKETIDEYNFARTIWWYFRSGNDVSQVFGEREFQRFIKAYA